MGEQLKELDALYKKYIADETFVTLRNRGATFVPGRGPLNPKIMIVGEKPGVTENELGKPFVGKTGTELVYLLKGADLDPEDIFYTCLLKYQSFNFDNDLLDASYDYMEKEISIVNPTIVGLCGFNVIKLFYPEVEEIITCNGKLFDGRYVPLFSPSAMIHTAHRRAYIRKGYEQLKQFADALAPI